MYHLETTYFIQIWREMSTWFENTFSVVEAYRLENFSFRPNLTWNVDFGSKTRSSMYHLETAQLIQIWREMSNSFENTLLVVQAYRLETFTFRLNLTWNVDFGSKTHKFYVWPRDYIFHTNFTWNVDLVRTTYFWYVKAYRLKNSLLAQIWREMSILGRKHKFFWFKTRSSMYHLETT